MQPTAHRSHWGVLTFVYGTLIVYGSLYPFSGWVHGRAPFDFLFDETKWSHRPSLGDVVTNLLAYAPFGFFAFRYWCSTHSVKVSAALAILVSASLSLGIEVLQGYLPARVQSSVDLLLNFISGTTGVALARLPYGEGRLSDLFRRLYAQWFVPGRLTDLALLAIAAWVTSQLLPLVPSLDVGKFRAALIPLERVVAEPATFNGWHALAETLFRTGMGVIVLSVVRPDKPALKAFTLLLASLLLAQIPIIDRQLLPEVLFASLASLPAILVLGRRTLGTRASWSFFLVFSAFCVSESLGSSAGDLNTFNWIPFSSSLENPVVGIGEMSMTIALTAALTWSVRTATESRRMRWLGWGVGVMVASAALALELNQSNIAGRTGDITTPLLLAVVWTIAWQYSSRSQAPGHQTGARVDANNKRAKRASTGGKHLHAWRPRYEVLTVAIVAAGVALGSQLPFMPYNVRELIYAGHPLRSSILLSIALYMTFAVPAWLAAICRRRPSTFIALPLALLLNATLTWFAVHNAVPSESIHDIVGAPILRWPDHIEVALRFIALHALFTLIVTGSVLLAMPTFLPGSWNLAGAWLFVFVVASPALYWAIIVEAATDNLTELMQDGGTPAAAAFLAVAGVLGFVPGCLTAAAGAFHRRRSLAFILALLAGLAATAFLLAGAESTISKNGQKFSALQFLLSTDRRHYAGPSELAVRYVLAFIVLTVVIAVVQFGVWRFLAFRQQGLAARSART